MGITCNKVLEQKQQALLLFDLNHILEFVQTRRIIRVPALHTQSHFTPLLSSISSTDLTLPGSFLGFSRMLILTIVFLSDADHPSVIAAYPPYTFNLGNMTMKTSQ